MKKAVHEGATLSDITAEKEYGVTREFILAQGTNNSQVASQRNRLSLSLSTHEPRTQLRTALP